MSQLEARIARRSELAGALCKTAKRWTIVVIRVWWENISVSSGTFGEIENVHVNVLDLHVMKGMGEPTIIEAASELLHPWRLATRRAILRLDLLFCPALYLRSLLFRHVVVAKDVRAVGDGYAGECEE